VELARVTVQRTQCRVSKRRLLTTDLESSGIAAATDQKNHRDRSLRFVEALDDKTSVDERVHVRGDRSMRRTHPNAHAVGVVIVGGPTPLIEIRRVRGPTR